MIQSITALLNPGLRIVHVGVRRSRAASHKQTGAVRLRSVLDPMQGCLVGAAGSQVFYSHEGVCRACRHVSRAAY
jgi:hypothetical protein